MTDNNEKVIPNVDSKSKEERNVPDLRFPNYNDNWCSNTIDELFLFLRNNTLSRDDLNYENGSCKNIHYGDILTKFNTLKDVSDSDVPFINNNIVSKNDLLYSNDIVIADTAEDYLVGKAIEIKNDNNVYTYSGLHTIPLRPKNKFASGFIAFNINSYSFRKRIHPLIQGIKVYSISKSALFKTKVYYPSFNEQSIISKFIQHLEERILTQKKIIEDYKLLKKAICDDYRKQNCTKCKIKDLALIGRGRVINSTEISHQKNPKYPVYSSQTLNNGIMGYLDGYDFDGEYITWTTDGANAGTVFYHNEKFNCTNVCGTIKVTNKMINPFYLSLILQYECKKYVSLNLANPKLMNNTMASIEVKVPNLDYQKRIINSVKILDEKILNEEKVLQLYQSQKDYLLNHMFI